jgi:CHAD domain-containing protein
MATPVIGDGANRVAQAAEEVQSVLGGHHDAVAAEDWLRAQVFSPSSQSGHAVSVASAFAAGCLAADEQRTQRRLRHRWRRSWKALRHEAKALSD